MSGDSFCSVLEALQIRRVYFFGDSLAVSQWKSLLNLLGLPLVEQASVDRTESATIECPNAYQRIPIMVAKETGGDGPPMVLSDTSREFLWSTNTTSNERTLSIWNIGAHYHTEKLFQHDFATLSDWMTQRPNDLVFFRTTPPGHADCEPRQPKQFNFTHGTRVVPLSNASQYPHTTLHDWDKMFLHNAHAQAHMPSSVRLLDVVPMTLLRSDGHSGGKDCLHYMSPGPLDWWNHLLYSHLKRLAAMEGRMPDAPSRT